jgi:hypothetical protein
MGRLLVIAALLAAGCGSAAAKGGTVPLDQLPPGMLATAKEKLPNVKFETAWRLADGRIEIRGKDPKGKIREVEFAADGKFVGIE